MALDIQIFTATSDITAHPSVQVTVPTGFKIIGGGAVDHWEGAGSLLTASYPLSENIWFAAGKDHEVSAPASVTAYAIALNDPKNEYEVKIIKSMSSNPEPHPQAVAVLPPNFVLTGGGARVDWNGAGNLLTASFPNGPESWEARSKDHDVSDPAKITAFAIGLRPKSPTKKLRHSIRKAEGTVAAHPAAQVQLEPGWELCGGGAIDEWHGDGNMLTASFPDGTGWSAAGKDHMHSDPAAITAFAIGVRDN